MAKQIAGSTECTTIVNQFKQDVTGTNYVRKTNSETTTLNSTTDLHLAYNNVNYSATGVKSNGKWTLTITFTDTYVFDAQSWKNAMTDNALVTILNNYAAYAQSIGAIVPYNVTVTVQTTFQEEKNYGMDRLYRYRHFSAASASVDRHENPARASVARLRR